MKGSDEEIGGRGIGETEVPGSRETGWSIVGGLQNVASGQWDQAFPWVSGATTGRGPSGQ